MSEVATPVTKQVSLHDALVLATRLHQGGRLQEAEKLYERILEVDAEQPDALHYLGLLAFQRGRPQEAVQRMRAAIQLSPEYADAHNNLGNVLRELSQPEEAMASFRRVIELVPEHADAHNNLGIALKDLGRLPEAEQSYREATAQRENFPDAYYNLGNTLQGLDRPDEAEAAYRQALTLHPGHYEAYKSLGLSLYQADHKEQAVEVFKAWLAAYPDTPMAAHMLAVCEGRESPKRASDQYIKKLFDHFAEEFDRHLAKLDYQAPKLLATILAKCRPDAKGTLSLLDAGCGTGLCGPLLRPFAKQLTGVDLSAGMLAKAKKRAVYDELIEEELTAYLSKQPQIWDGIISADTLVYFGDLRPVLYAAAEALRPGGILLFTVESHAAQKDGPSFELNAQGRYSHTEPYLQSALLDAGFQVAGLTPVTLRMENGVPVQGWAVEASLRADRTANSQ